MRVGGRREEGGESGKEAGGGSREQGEEAGFTVTITPSPSPSGITGCRELSSVWSPELWSSEFGSSEFGRPKVWELRAREVQS